MPTAEGHLLPAPSTELAEREVVLPGQQKARQQAPLAVETLVSTESMAGRGDSCGGSAILQFCSDQKYGVVLLIQGQVKDSHKQ